MIRINLLAVEKERAKKKGPIQAGQKIILGAVLIMVLGALAIGWRFWSTQRDSKSADAKIVAAQQEAGRLQGIIKQVQSFELRKGQLQQRVTLIEQLRKGQTGPVHLLDQVSRSLPPMLWLTEVKQGKEVDVVIDGRCTSQTSVSDFVANLEGSGYFKRPIEIVASATEPLATPPGELVKFTIKAQFQTPGEAPAAARPGAASSPAK